MTVPELLALPIGQRVHWNLPDIEGGLSGEVVGRITGGPSIAWEDGQVTDIYLDDDGLAEFAGWLERVVDLYVYDEADG